MKKAVIYIHGKGGNIEECEHYKPIFNDSDVIGFDYKSETPWEAKDEFKKYYDLIRKNYDSISIIANSIGAFFTMQALYDLDIKKAMFISPIVNMEKFILDMMFYTNVTEEELLKKGEIKTNFGETLSWEYLSFVRKHPITWKIPTAILYGEKDNLTSLETMQNFANTINAPLTIMKNGEHWFHTKEQMDFLDNWIVKFV